MQGGRRLNLLNLEGFMQHRQSACNKGKPLGLGVLVLWAVCICFAPAAAESWSETNSRHFRVFYVEEAAFAAAVSEWAEHYYTQITLDLGINHVVKRDWAPWLWERRCRIYLHPDRDAYLRATGAPAWSGGMVNYRQRVVHSFIGAPAFLDKTLPHELAHIVFREFVGIDNARVPRWLDEGVAQYAERGRREESLDLMRQGVAQGVFLPLAQLQQAPLGHVSSGVAQVFYAQAVSMVHFFLEQYGSRRFIDLCRNLRDGYSLERAVSFATSGHLRSLADFEAVWYQFILRLS
jgi:hypothetical protein